MKKKERRHILLERRQEEEEEDQEEEEEGKHLIAHLKQERGNDSYTHRESCLNMETPVGVSEARFE